MALHRSIRELDFRLEDLAELPPPPRVLLADPAHFETREALNPHMLDAGGRLKAVDRARAREQWEALRELYLELGLEVDVLAAEPGQPDLVFCANPALPVPAAAMADGRPRVVPSRMAHPSREGEVRPVVAALQKRGYAPLLIERGERIEGTGDGLWHPGRALLWAGSGPRSSLESWRELAERIEAPVIALDLIEPDFYHLDTCLALLAEDACLWLPSALGPAGRAFVRALVPRAIEADEREARELLACNAFSPDGERVLLQKGCRETARRLEAAGFKAVEVDTGEFLKSGGSVFCMKLAWW